MPGGVHRGPNTGKIAQHARRRLVVDDAYRLDLPRRVGAQTLLDPVRVDPGTPVARQIVDLETQPLRHLLPALREEPGFRHEHAVSRSQRVDQGRLPGPVARRTHQHHRRRRPQQLLQPAVGPFGHGQELRTSMVRLGRRHCGHDPPGDVGRPRRVQELPAGASRPIGWIKQGSVLRRPDESQCQSATRCAPALPAYRHARRRRGEAHRPAR